LLKLYLVGQQSIHEAKKMKLQKEQASYDYASALSRLNLWLVSDSSFAPAEDLPEGWSTPLLPEEEISAHPELKLATERKGLAEANKKAVNAQYFPKFNAQYGSQEILGESGFYQYQVGISIPLFFMQTRGRSQAAQIQTEIANEQLRQKEMELNSRYQSALQEYLKWQNSLNFYRDEALPLAEEQRKGTVLAFGEGAIDYTVFIQNMREAVQVEAQAQEALGNYLNARFQLEYFLSSNNQ
jgi:cobalt-zinc-cadmium resistance protein CzcA